MTFRTFSTTIGLVFFALGLSALEIPLKSASSQGTSVGFVDMERVYRDYPETRKAQDDYARELSRRRAILDALEQDLTDLKAQVAGVAVSSETLAVSTPKATMDDVTRKQSALDKERQAAAQDLRDWEEKRSQQILGTLYKALVQLAEEKGVGLVVDKSSLLYGRPAIDLTDALSRRVRGLPEE